MPYALQGNKVVKKGSGEVVKDHGDDHEKAVKHLRALKANVEEGVLCECGAPALGPSGLVCQRGHRLVEAIGSVKKGAFHAWLGKDEDEPITDADIERGLKAGGHPAKMAQFAKAARGWGKGKSK